MIKNLTHHDVNEFRAELTELIKEVLLVSDFKKENIDDLAEKKILSLEKNLKEGTGYSLGFLNSNQLIGFIWYYLKQEDKNQTYHIAYVATGSRFKKMGVATKLLNTVKENASKNNVDYIELNVDSDNQLAKKLYKKLGYNEKSATMRLEISD